MGRRFSVNGFTSSELEGRARNQRPRVEDELAVSEVTDGELAWCELVGGELAENEVVVGELAWCELVDGELAGCSPLTSPDELVWCGLVGALAWLEFAAGELVWV